MNCAACGRENRENASFCDKCGARLIRPCSSCGARIAAGSSFCDKCGVPAATAGGVASDADPQGDVSETQAHSDFAAAKKLLAREGSDDRKRGFELLSRALGAYKTLGLSEHLDRALRLKLESQGMLGADTRASIHAVALAVQVAMPDLRSYSGEEGLITLLFSDMGEDLPPAHTPDAAEAELRASHSRIMRQAIEDFDGFEVRSENDGFMVAFPSATEGVRCAVGMLGRIAGHNERHPDRRIPIRIGLHSAEAVTEDEDYYRHQVAVACAVAAEASVGEVLVSGSCRELAGEIEGIAFNGGREAEVEGVAGAYEVFSVVA